MNTNEQVRQAVIDMDGFVHCDGHRMATMRSILECHTQPMIDALLEIIDLTKYDAMGDRKASRIYETAKQALASGQAQEGK